MKRLAAICIALIMMQIHSIEMKANSAIADSGCYSEFTYSVNYAVDFIGSGIAINFFSKANGHDLKYLWDFGDGSTSEEKDPMHAFTKMGMLKDLPYLSAPYSKVCLTVYNGDCKHYSCKYIPLWGDTQAHALCTAFINYYELKDDSMITIPEYKRYQFRGSSDNNVVSWQWFVEDSLFSFEQNPILWLQLNWNDRYQQYGTEVSLKILTADSCKSEVRQFVPWQNDSNKCFVYYSYYKDSAIVDSSKVRIHFNSINELNSRMITPEEEIVSWKWDFGDGTTSTEANPVHDFTIPMIKCGANMKCIVDFKVCLTTTNASGCVANYCSVVYPTTKPDPSCAAKFSYVMSKSLPPIYNFKNESMWTGGSVYWSFGDDTYSTEENPNHVFNTIEPMPYDTMVYDSIKYLNNERLRYEYIPFNNYNVCLTIYDVNGCSDTYCHDIYAEPNPTICTNKIKLSTSYILGTYGCTGNAWAELVSDAGIPVAASKYYWSTGNITPNAANLCSNTSYYVTISDYNGCETAGSFALNDNSIVWDYYGNWQYEGKDDNYTLRFIPKDEAYSSYWKFEDSSLIVGSEVNYNFNGSVNKWVDLVITDNKGNAVKTERIYIGNNSTNLSKIESPEAFEIYPIPANESLNLKLNNQTEAISIEILDVMGKVRMSYRNELRGNTETKIDIAQLTKGIYLCRIKAGNSILATKKFIKN